MTVSTFGVKVLCSRCEREVEGAIVEDNLQIVDSPGFVIFDSGLVCDDCLPKPDYLKEIQ